MVATTRDSVQDKMVRNSKATTLTTNTKIYKATIKDNAKHSVESAALQTVKGFATNSLGLKNDTADQLLEVIKHGRNATDSILNLTTKSIDSFLGTNSNDILNQLIPSTVPLHTEPAAQGLGILNPNSIAAKMDKRGDPLMNFHWTIELPQLPTLPNIDMSIFNFYIEDANIGLPFFTSESVFRNGTHIHYPKFSDSGSLNLTFYEDCNLNATAYLQAWNYLIQDPNTGFYNKPSFYKKPIKLTPYDACNIPCGVFFIDAAWPSQIQGYGFNSGNSENMKISCEFGLNRIRYEPYPEREAMIAALPHRPGGMSSPNITSASLIDIINHPLEFGKSVLGIKSNFPIKF